MNEQLSEGFAKLCAQRDVGVERAVPSRSSLDDNSRLPASDLETRVGKVRALLDHSAIRDDLAGRRIRRKVSPDRFNVFEALWIDRREVYHSRFLAYLLDPRQHHDQGAVFLKVFLQALSDKMNVAEPDEWLASLNYEACRVTAERDAEAAGRIDLVLEFPCGTRIAIENKVDHFEGNRQLPRYREWLDKRSRSCGKQVLVFLTPEGRVSEDDWVECVRFSYEDLAEALAKASSKCSQTAVPLLAVLHQYIQLCRRLAGRSSEVEAPSKEILEILRDPGNLAVALDVESHLSAIKDEVKKTFRGRVLELIRLRLSDNSIWTAETKRSWDEYVCVKTKADQGWGHTSSNYSCGVVLSFKKLHGGWHRPAHIDLGNRPAVNDSSDIEARMSSEGMGTPTEDWVCCTNHIDGIPHLIWCSDLEDILAIHRDNLGEGGLDLAASVANWIWERFDRYRDEIERLESFKISAGQRY